MNQNENPRPVEFAKTFVAGYLNDFEKDILREKNRWFPSATISEIAKERIALDIFNWGHLFPSVFKDNQQGKIIFNKLVDTCVEGLVKMGFSSTISEYQKFLHEKLLSYENDWKNKKEPNPLHWISKQYCFSLKSHNPEVLRQVAVSLAKSAEVYREVLEKIRKIYRI